MLINNYLKCAIRDVNHIQDISKMLITGEAVMYRRTLTPFKFISEFKSVVK